MWYDDVMVKTSAKAFSRALRGSIKSAIPKVLTELSIQAKKEAPDQIERDMTLRSRSFISRAIRYQKATRSSLKSYWGIVERERFSGLVEQERGRTDEYRAPTLKGARRGSLKKRVAPKSRLRSGVKVAKVSDFKRKPKSDTEMLAVWRSVNYRGLFKLPEAQGRRKGIYRFKGRSGQLELVHAVGDIPDPRKRPWMQHTNERVLKSGKGEKAWKRTMKKFMRDRISRYK